MAHERCPWWIGYFLASPIRRFHHNPNEILRPFVTEGMTVYEPGPGMGFFTLELARLVGRQGRVFAVDVQPRMLQVLGRKAKRAGLAERIELRTVEPGDLGLRDLAERVDFVLAFAMVHELPDAARFFSGSFAALKTGGRMLFSEPAGHVGQEEFEKSVELAWNAGFHVDDRPSIPSNLSAVLRKG